MALGPVVPLLALLGLAFVAKSRKKTPAGGAPGGGDFPPGDLENVPVGAGAGAAGSAGGGAPLPIHGPQPGSLDPIPGIMPLKSGHLGWVIAAYYGGSIGDIKAANTSITDINAWKAGSKFVTKITLPGKWLPWSKPLPAPNPSGPVASDPPEYPLPVT